MATRQQHLLNVSKVLGLGPMPEQAQTAQWQRLCMEILGRVSRDLEAACKGDLAVLKPYTVAMYNDYFVIVRHVKTPTGRPRKRTNINARGAYIYKSPKGAKAAKAEPANTKPDKGK